MAQLPTLLDMLQAGVHFGHKESRWHPKMKQYIFGARGGVHIIDLERTLAKMKEATEYVKQLTARGGVILFLGTKRQARDIIKKYAEECGAPYVCGRWLGGTLTNFTELMALLKRYHDLRKQRESGELEKYTKKEQAQFAKQIAELDEKVGGLSTLNRPPDAIFVVDLKKEKTAVAEAQVRRIPIVALVDTNANPDLVAHAIPSNDDAVKTIELMTKIIADAVKEGKVMREEKAKADADAKAKAEAKTAETTAQKPLA